MAARTNNASKSRKARRGGGLFARTPIAQPRLVLDVGQAASRMLAANTPEEIDAAFEHVKSLVTIHEK